MELEVNGQVVEQPRPDAIRGAVAEAGADPEWDLTLSDERGYMTARPDMTRQRRSLRAIR